MKPYGPRQNNPDDPLAMAMYSLESGLMTYAISVQICWQKYSKMCAWNPTVPGKTTQMTHLQPLSGEQL